MSMQHSLVSGAVMVPHAALHSDAKSAADISDSPHQS